MSKITFEITIDVVSGKATVRRGERGRAGLLSLRNARVEIVRDAVEKLGEPDADGFCWIVRESTGRVALNLTGYIASELTP